MNKITGLFVPALLFVLFFMIIDCSAVLANGSYDDNSDGTVSDLGTGLMWQKADDGIEYTWEEALNYSENLTLAGYSD